MKTFHPASWSQQAREMANYQFEQWRYYNEHPEKAFMITREDAEGNLYEISSMELRVYQEFFSRSYRNPLITKRAAKRFGRLVRKFYAN